jgi:hypothetical protein
MTEPAAARRESSAAAPAGRRSGVLLAFLAAGLAAFSVVQYREIPASRRPAEAFARRFALDLRRPFEAWTIRISPAGDLAAAIAAESALSDAGDPPPGGTLDPRAARAWSRVASERQEELAAARGLLLDTLARRPGSAAHRLLLGRLALAERDGRAPAPPPETWTVPLQAAASAAPGVDAVWGALSRATLEDWPRLPPGQRDDARRVFRRAFLDPAVVARDYPDARRHLGAAADSLLPDDMASLAAALDALGGRAEIPDLFALLQRLTQATREDRARRLQRIERLQALGQADRLRSAIEGFAVNHTPELSDDKTGRAQSARVLELWPDGHPGVWPSHARAALLVYFLRGREADVSPAALGRAVEALSGVPAHLRADVLLANGAIADAEKIARSVASIGDPDWTAYFVRLSRAHLDAGRPAEAQEALTRIAFESSESCEVLVARREVARALGEAAETAALDRALVLLSDPVPPEGLSAVASLSLCVAPERAGRGSFAVRVRSPGDTIVTYGWDGGRLGLLRVSREGLVRVPVPATPGARVFSVSRLYGENISLHEPRVTG